MVTYIFKTFSKHRGTQCWNLLPEIWNIYNQRQLVSINFERKYKNFIFSCFLKDKSYFFVCETEFYVKNAFFEVLHINISQKLQIFNILLIFSNFSVDFQFYLIFVELSNKIFWKRAEWIGIDATFQGNIIFGLNLAPEPK